VYPGGVNFSVYSKNSTAIELLLFEHVDDVGPARVIALDPKQNHTYHYWHVFVSGLKPGQVYAYRAHGPYQPDQGLRFDGDKVLLDPYGRGVALPKSYNRSAAAPTGR